MNEKQIKKQIYLLTALGAGVFIIGLIVLGHFFIELREIKEEIQRQEIEKQKRIIIK